MKGFIMKKQLLTLSSLLLALACTSNPSILPIKFVSFCAKQPILAEIANRVAEFSWPPYDQGQYSFSRCSVISVAKAETFSLTPQESAEYKASLQAWHANDIHKAIVTCNVDDMYEALKKARTAGVNLNNLNLLHTLIRNASRDSDYKETSKKIDMARIIIQEFNIDVNAKDQQERTAARYSLLLSNPAAAVGFVTLLHQSGADFKIDDPFEKALYDHYLATRTNGKSDGAFAGIGQLIKLNKKKI
jgi:hypothetical protein